jgi:hypothetical protein
VPRRDLRGDLDLLQRGDFNHGSILAVQRRTMQMGKSQRPVISAARDFRLEGGRFGSATQTTDERIGRSHQ